MSVRARPHPLVPVLLFAVALSPLPSVRAADAPRPMTAQEFLRQVLASNLDYAAQRYNVDLARADAAAARIWPNPTLALSAQRDLTYHGKTAPGPDGAPVLQTLPEPRAIGLTQTLELAGQRRWRVRTAEQTYQAAAATLEDFLRNLAWDAIAAYTDAQTKEAAVEQQRKAAGYAAELVRAQEARYRSGDLSEADFTASRLEELQLQNDLMSAEADAEAARLALATFLGRDQAPAGVHPEDRLAAPSGDYDLGRLTAQALENRPDLVALRRTRDAAQSGVHGARASRIPDVDLGLTYTDSPASQNLIAPAPHDHQLGVSLSLPLPLWNRNQTEIRKAQASAAQAERQLDSAELKAQIQVRTAFGAYRSALARLAQFRDGLLRGAESVLAARRYSYEHGQTSLLELLDAERTDNDVQQKYLEAIADAAKARIDLLRAAGVPAP